MSKNLAKIIKIFTLLFSAHIYMWYIYMYTVILGYYHIIYVYIITWLVFLFFFFCVLFLALFLANKVRFASYFEFHISWGQPGEDHTQALNVRDYTCIYTHAWVYVCCIYSMLDIHISSCTHIKHTYSIYIYMFIYIHIYSHIIQINN